MAGPRARPTSGRARRASRTCATTASGWRASAPVFGPLGAAGLALALLMALAAAVTVATVVRLGLHARRDEIEIMELVGAPLAFIRGPFVAEGLLQGGIGALVALVALCGRVCRWSVPGGERTLRDAAGRRRRSSFCRCRFCRLLWWRAGWWWAAPADLPRRVMPV